MMSAFSPEQLNSINVGSPGGQASEVITVNGDSAPLLRQKLEHQRDHNSKEVQSLPATARCVPACAMAPGAFADGIQAARRWD